MLTDMRAVALAMSVWLFGGCADDVPVLSPKGYRLAIDGAPDGWNARNNWFEFRIDHDGTVGGWGCYYWQPCDDARANRCVNTYMTADEHAQMTDILNSSGIMGLQDDFECGPDVPGWRFRIEIGQPGGAGRDVTACGIGIVGLDRAVTLGLDVIDACR